ncbi:hypothetical protein BS78_K065900 [Paspalum vaginatum]|uniref:Reverse transcriptase zinc-binding domain-containing protein n=1 Tax=Paspalum vaginatum TaxID=158149 RepID=A0A9W8CFG4_9POAL|nr:hypothetical protein BS78_K065900 [Paspalum vaginatum]
MLERRHFNIHSDCLCVLCSSREIECIDHLFLSCPFSVDCWNKLNIQWDLHIPIDERLYRAKQNFQEPWFMETFIFATWTIWNLRNDIIFDRRPHSFSLWCRNFRSTAPLQICRMKKSVKPRLAFGWTQCSPLNFLSAVLCPLYSELSAPCLVLVLVLVLLR